MIPANDRNGDKLDQLKDILLKEDREKLSDIQHKWDEPDFLKEKISPIFEEQFSQLKKDFPKEYESTINHLIEQKLKASQQEIVDIIYPKLGKLIKKYINFQIQTFKEAVDERLKNTFTVKSFFSKIKANLFGFKESDVIISELINYRVEEVYLIQKDSGLLIGSASREKTIDKEVIASMLTAIKAFVEDAFKKEQEELESIQYGSYQIILQSFYSFYIALAVSGPISAAQQNKLGDKILDFVEENLKDVNDDTRDLNVEAISAKLYKVFIEN